MSLGPMLLLTLYHLITFWPFEPLYTPESYKIFKRHTMAVIFVYIMGNYIAFKNYTQKEPTG